MIAPRPTLAYPLRGIGSPGRFHRVTPSRPKPCILFDFPQHREFFQWPETV